MESKTGEKAGGTSRNILMGGAAAIVVVAGGLLFGRVSSALTNNQAPAPPQTVTMSKDAQPRPDTKDAEPRVEGIRGTMGWRRLQNKLSLTPEQADKLQPLLEGYVEQWKGHRRDAMAKYNEMVHPVQKQEGNQPRPRVKLTSQQMQQLQSLQNEVRKASAADRTAMIAKTTGFLSADQRTELEQMLSTPRGARMFMPRMGRPGRRHRSGPDQG